MGSKIDYKNIVKKLSPYNIKKGILYFKHYGAREFWIKLTERFQKDDIDYNRWFANHRPTDEDLDRERRKVFGCAPVISILVPVYNTPELFLKQMMYGVDYFAAGAA